MKKNFFKVFAPVFAPLFALWLVLALAACATDGNPAGGGGDPLPPPAVPGVFAYVTDIDEVIVVNGALKFTASATYDGAPCTFYVTANGALLEAQSPGVYSLDLRKGKNAVSINALGAGFTDKKDYSVDFGAFVIVSNAKNTDTLSNRYDFVASAGYGGAACGFEASLDGEPLSATSGNNYTAVLAVGTHELALRAFSGNMSQVSNYTIRYSDKLPSATSTIEDGKTYKGSRLTFSVEAADGLDEHIGQSGLTVQGDYNSKLTPASHIHSDAAASSYSLKLDSVVAAGGTTPVKGSAYDIQVRITVKDAFGQSVTETYDIKYAHVEIGDPIGHIAFSIEGFTIGLGYIEKPVLVEIAEGRNLAQILQEDILAARGYATGHSGGSSSLDGAYYLANINKSGLLNGNAVDEDLWPFVLASYPAAQRSMPDSAGSLGQFNFCSGSGWMYSANGRFPNYSIGAYYPTDGDVIRLQFTLLLGRDVGGGQVVAGGNSLLTGRAVLEPITMLLAQIESGNLYAADAGAAYDAAVIVVSKWNPQKADVDAAAASLRGAYALS
ncbi:MAG: DUF4430 domain-containing protein [Clostridiales bacterium]|jgi:hypothetical protein|nr:DUF4430 domain-containing protein [Clostridiales bacterium]